MHSAIDETGQWLMSTNEGYFITITTIFTFVHISTVVFSNINKHLSQKTRILIQTNNGTVLQPTNKSALTRTEQIASSVPLSVQTEEIKAKVSYVSKIIICIR
jgi:hypothetical protein